MRFPVVLFDLDGTLVDSGPIILASYRHATRTVLGVELPESVFRPLVGLGLHDQMRRFSEERADELIRVYREHNEPLHDGLLAFPGVLDVLCRLRAGGRTVGVVTAKRRATAQLAFDRVGFGGLFDVVVGAEDTELHKPHPEPILKALELLGAAPADAAYVGDSPYDVAAARAAAVHAVWVSWGGIHDEERILEGEHPDAIVHSAEELLAAVA